MAVVQACIDCVVRKMMKFAESKIPEDIREDFINEATSEIKEYGLGNENMELEAVWERVARKYLYTHDVHREEKETFQKCILDMKDDIKALLKDSDDILGDAIKFAIAGNIIDFSTEVAVSFEVVKETIEKVKHFSLDKDLFDKFVNDIKNAKNLVILLDNVGEVVFDTILVEVIKQLYPNINIIAMPSTYPISSDTTCKEVYESGMADFAQIIPNGNDVTGTYLPKCSPEAIEAIEKADVIISKGMANFESLAGSDYNIYYFFICKCTLYAKLLEVDMFAEMFLSDRYSNTKVCRKEFWHEKGIV